MKKHPMPTQEDLRGNAGPLLTVLAERVLDFRDLHLHEGSDYLDAIVNGQKPLAFVSQCIDGRQPVHTITGLPLGKLIAQNSIAGFLRDYPDSPTAWASMLFAVKTLGAPVIIKLGHTGCGGVRALIDLCWGKTLAEIIGTVGLDPTIEWLQSAVPLTCGVFEKNPDLPKDQMMRALEEDLVRDGVKKLERFVQAMLQQGHLSQQQKPVVAGLLFEMHTAKLYHLLPDGEFKPLSETQVVVKPPPSPRRRFLASLRRLRLRMRRAFRPPAI
jgi:carbonic anhydrase